MSSLTLELSDDDVARIADAVAARLIPQKGNVSIEDAAKELCISVRTAHRHIKTCRLRGIKAGGRVIVTPESIERLMAAQGWAIE